MDSRHHPSDQPHHDDPTQGDVGDALEADAPEEQLSPEPTVVRTDVGQQDRRSEPDGTLPVGSPGRPRTYVPKERSWVWPLISLVGLVVVVLMNFLANWLPLNGQGTGEISNAHPVPFQPAGWVFSIWSVIYGLLLIFVIYSFFPSGRLNGRIQSIGPLFLITNLANVSWLFLWHWEHFQAAMFALVVLLLTLAAIYLLLRSARRDTGTMSTIQRLIVSVPFSVYLAWSCIATLANVQVWMREGGWDGAMFGLRGWTVIFLLVGIIVAAGIAFFAHDAAFPAVFVWAYLGIAQRQWGEDMLISILAIVLVVAAAALTAMALILSFDRQNGAGRASVSPGGLWRRGSPDVNSRP